MSLKLLLTLMEERKRGQKTEGNEEGEKKVGEENEKKRKVREDKESPFCPPFFLT